MELIDAMPPGLYEIVTTPKPATAAPSEDEAADFDLAIEERSLDDIRALVCNSLEDEREFAAAARVSDLNNALYPSCSLGSRWRAAHRLRPRFLS
jgi:Protein of unknown function (DUF3141)